MLMMIRGWKIHAMKVHRLDSDVIEEFRGATKRENWCCCCCCCRRLVLLLYERQLRLQRQMKKTALDIDDGRDIAGGRSV